MRRHKLNVCLICAVQMFYMFPLCCWSDLKNNPKYKTSINLSAIDMHCLITVYSYKWIGIGNFFATIIHLRFFSIHSSPRWCSHHINFSQSMLHCSLVLLEEEEDILSCIQFTEQPIIIKYIFYEGYDVKALVACRYVWFLCRNRF